MVLFTIAGENGDIIDALLCLAERCFNISKEIDITYGATVSSPLTFLRIIHQIHPLFRGGGKNYLLPGEMQCDVMYVGQEVECKNLVSLILKVYRM